jgi:excinuclease ABC subunit A
VDLGPGGGDEGGRLVIEGTPEQVAACEASWTGRFLADEMARAGAPVFAREAQAPAGRARRASRAPGATPARRAKPVRTPGR